MFKFNLFENRQSNIGLRPVFITMLKCIQCQLRFWRSETALSRL